MCKSLCSDYQSTFQMFLFQFAFLFQFEFQPNATQSMKFNNDLKCSESNSHLLLTPKSKNMHHNEWDSMTITIEVLISIRVHISPPHQILCNKNEANQSTYSMFLFRFAFLFRHRLMKYAIKETEHPRGACSERSSFIQLSGWKNNYELSRGAAPKYSICNNLLYLK